MKARSAWPAFLALVLLAGCGTARMPVPEPLAGAQPLAVQGRQGLKIREHLRFGSYEARDIDRSWVRGSDLEVLLYEGNRRKQHYTFVLREGARQRWHVSCAAFLRKRALHTPLVDVELTNRSELDCSLHAADGTTGGPAEVWHLALTETRERPLEGVLTREGARLAVRGTSALQGGLPAEATTGYHILEEGRTVGAVEVINAGRVWLDGSAPAGRRDLLSATAAALLLLEDLRAHLPEETALR